MSWSARGTFPTSGSGGVCASLVPTSQAGLVTTLFADCLRLYVGPLAGEAEQSRSVDATDEVRLAEFSGLRQEIGQRTAIQQALVALNLTVATSISGFVASGNSGGVLFLALVFASCTFGLLWLDHHLSIHQIGSYLETEVWRWEPSWQDNNRTHPKPAWWRAVYFLSIFLAFIGVAVTAIALAATNLPGQTRVLWWIGIGFTLLCSLAFLVALLSGPARLK